MCVCVCVCVINIDSTGVYNVKAERKPEWTQMRNFIKKLWQMSLYTDWDLRWQSDSFLLAGPIVSKPLGHGMQWSCHFLGWYELLGHGWHLLFLLRYQPAEQLAASNIVKCSVHCGSVRLNKWHGKLVSILILAIPFIYMLAILLMLIF